MDESPIVDALDPEDAFAVLADETRIDILRALWEADGQEATFSELREAVGVRDSGQFNYHLGKLTGRFVGKTDEGYELRTAGQEVVGSLLSGSYTMTADLEPIDLEDPCPVCNGPMTFDYEHERVVVECDECFYAGRFPVPPGAFAGYEVDRFPDVTERYVRTFIAQFSNGFCPSCTGPVEPELITLDDLGGWDVPAEFANVASVKYDCERCGSSSQLDLKTVLLTHPAVVSFYHDHGTDVRDISIFRQREPTEIPQTQLLEGDPPRATVTYTTDDASLTLTVDDALEVVDIDRSDN